LEPQKVSLRITQLFINNLERYGRITKEITKIILIMMMIIIMKPLKKKEEIFLMILNKFEDL
jgi:hypothetical protein